MTNPDQNSVIVRRLFKCPVNTLFKWLIEPDLIALWFGPKQIKVVKVQNKIAVGGKYQIKLQKPNDDIFYIQGIYLEILKPNKIVYSFDYVGLNKAPPSSVVSITLEKVDNSVTKLTLTQTFDQIPLDMVNRTKAWKNMMLLLSQFVTEVKE